MMRIWIFMEVKDSTVLTVNVVYSIFLCISYLIPIIKCIACSYDTVFMRIVEKCCIVLLRSNAAYCFSISVEDLLHMSSANRSYVSTLCFALTLQFQDCSVQVVRLVYSWRGMTLSRGASNEIEGEARVFIRTSKAPLSSQGISKQPELIIRRWGMKYHVSYRVWVLVLKSEWNNTKFQGRVIPHLRLIRICVSQSPLTCDRQEFVSPSLPFV